MKRISVLALMSLWGLGCAQQAAPQAQVQDQEQQVRELYSKLAKYSAATPRIEYQLGSFQHGGLASLGDRALRDLVTIPAVNVNYQETHYYGYNGTSAPADSLGIVYSPTLLSGASSWQKMLSDQSGRTVKDVAREVFGDDADKVTYETYSVHVTVAGQAYDYRTVSLFDADPAAARAEFHAEPVIGTWNMEKLAQEARPLYSAKAVAPGKGALPNDEMPVCKFGPTKTVTGPTTGGTGYRDHKYSMAGNPQGLHSGDAYQTQVTQSYTDTGAATKPCQETIKFTTWQTEKSDTGNTCSGTHYLTLQEQAGNNIATYNRGDAVPYAATAALSVGLQVFLKEGVTGFGLTCEALGFGGGFNVSWNGTVDANEVEAIAWKSTAQATAMGPGNYDVNALSSKKQGSVGKPKC